MQRSRHLVAAAGLWDASATLDSPVLSGDVGSSTPVSAHRHSSLTGLHISRYSLTVVQGCCSWAEGGLKVPPFPPLLFKEGGR